MVFTLFGRNSACQCSPLQREKDALVEDLSKTVSHVADLEQIIFDLDRKLQDIQYGLPVTSAFLHMVKPSSDVSLPESITNNPTYEAVYESINDGPDEWYDAASDRPQDQEDDDRPDLEQPGENEVSSEPPSLKADFPIETSDKRSKTATQSVPTEPADLGDHSRIKNDSNTGIWISAASSQTHAADLDRESLPSFHPRLFVSVHTQTLLEDDLSSESDENATRIPEEEELLERMDQLKSSNAALLQEKFLIQRNLVELTMQNHHLAYMIKELQKQSQVESIQDLNKVADRRQPPTTGSDLNSKLPDTESSTLAVDDLPITSEVKASLIRVRLNLERQQHAHAQSVLNTALENSVKSNRTLTDSLERFRAERDQMEELFFDGKTKAEDSQKVQKQLEKELECLRPISAASKNDTNFRTVSHITYDTASGARSGFSSPFRDTDVKPEKIPNARKRIKKLLTGSRRSKYRLWKKKSAKKIVTLI